MVTVRRERTKDYEAIHELNKLAFGGEEEALLVQRLRKSPNFIPELSLVAVKSGRVVGHILFSSIIIESQSGALPALSLAPMAVLPEFQNQGIGSELVRHGLRESKRLGHNIVIVVGHPGYYPRFGFVQARAKGLEVPFKVPDEAFMVLELIPGALDGIKGALIYPPEFNDLIQEP